MPRIVRCNHCDKEGKEDQLMNWLGIELIGMVTTTFQMGGIVDKTFCSVKCLTRYFYEGGYHGYDE